MKSACKCVGLNPCAGNKMNRLVTAFKQDLGDVMSFYNLFKKKNMIVNLLNILKMQHYGSVKVVGCPLRGGYALIFPTSSLNFRNAP